MKNSYLSRGSSATVAGGERSGIGSAETSGASTITVEVVSVGWAPPAGRSLREGGEGKLAGGSPVRRGKLKLRGLREGPLSAKGPTRTGV